MPVQQQTFQQGGKSIADMIKNFDKQRKEGPPEKNIEEFMDEAERIYI